MDSNTIIALCSIIIALAALLATLWQARATCTHNKLSVKPILNTEEDAHPNRSIKLTLHNKGVGPALIKQYKIMLDNEEHSVGNVTSFETLISKIGLNYQLTEWDGCDPSYSVLLPGESVTLLCFRESHEDESLHDYLIEQLPRIDFLVEYECIYKTKFILKGRSHLR